MIRNAPIILLDEPTTGLDATSEALVMEGLARLIVGRTAIIIAHRLSTVSRCNSILVLEGAGLLRQDTPTIARPRGTIIAELYEVQFGDRLPPSRRQPIRDSVTRKMTLEQRNIPMAHI